MTKAKRTEAAERDLEDIAFQIAVVDNRPDVAEKILRELVAESDRLASLASRAILGTATPELGEGVRLFPHKRWVIVFRYFEDTIVVLRIADASQDYLAWNL